MKSAVAAEAGIFVAALWCLIGLTACGTKQVNLVELSSDTSLRTVLLKEVEYDRMGLPLFLKTLHKRPVDPGERFTIALFQDSMPVKTFDIAIKRPHGDFKVPLRIVYRWTGAGFMVGGAVGLTLAGVVLDGSDGEDDGRELKNAVGVALVPTVIGAAGGFAVGLMASVPDDWAETEKAILRGQETVVTYTDYEYNEQRQLRHMTMYNPETKAPLVRTDFYYEDDGNTPESAYIRSYPENKVRVIDKNGARDGQVFGK